MKVMLDACILEMVDVLKNIWEILDEQPKPCIMNVFMKKNLMNVFIATLVKKKQRGTSNTS